MRRRRLGNRTGHGHATATLVVAAFAVGSSIAAAPIAASATTTSGYFHSLPGTRVLASHAVPVSTAVNFTARGVAGIPSTGVSAVALQVTVSSVANSGYVWVYPTGGSRSTPKIGRASCRE